MAKMCQNCGTIVNDDSANNCVNCGAVLVASNPQAYTQPQQQYQQPQYQAPQYQQQYQQPQVPSQQKSKIAAGILGIVVGCLGVHNFYLGYTGKAVAQLLITILTCGVGAIISGIWGLIEGVMILAGSINTDANGMPLGD